MAEKVSKDEAEFVKRHHGEEKCGNCKHFLPKFDRCRKVMGEILWWNYCHKFFENK